MSQTVTGMLLTDLPEIDGRYCYIRGSVCPHVSWGTERNGARIDTGHKHNKQLRHDNPHI